MAWLEFHSLKQEAQQRRLSPMLVARARQGWIRMAAMMRVVEHSADCDDGRSLHGTSDCIPKQRVLVEQSEDRLATLCNLVNGQIPKKELRSAFALAPE